MKWLFLQSQNLGSISLKLKKKWFELFASPKKKTIYFFRSLSPRYINCVTFWRSKLVISMRLMRSQLLLSLHANRTVRRNDFQLDWDGDEKNRSSYFIEDFNRSSSKHPPPHSFSLFPFCCHLQQRLISYRSKRFSQNLFASFHSVELNESAGNEKIFCESLLPYSIFD